MKGSFAVHCRFSTLHQLEVVPPRFSLFVIFLCKCTHIFMQTFLLFSSLLSHVTLVMYARTQKLRILVFQDIKKRDDETDRVKRREEKWLLWTNALCIVGLCHSYQIYRYFKLRIFPLIGQLIELQKSMSLIVQTLWADRISVLYPKLGQASLSWVLSPKDK